MADPADRSNRLNRNDPPLSPPAVFSQEDLRGRQPGSTFTFCTPNTDGFGPVKAAQPRPVGGSADRPRKGREVTLDTSSSRKGSERPRGAESLTSSCWRSPNDRANWSSVESWIVRSMSLRVNDVVLL